MKKKEKKCCKKQIKVFFPASFNYPGVYFCNNCGKQIDKKK